jgi:hypothetical protein
MIACALLIFAAAAALAQTPQPFSSDFTTTMPNGNTATGKWFFSPPKMRIDITSMGNSDNHMNVIMDTSTQTTYMLMPQQQMYIETHGNSGQGAPALNSLRQLGSGDPCAAQSNLTCKKLGTETVNGRSCDKWEGTDKNSGKATILWIDQKLHFPIKAQEPNGIEVNFTNIKEGAPDASLFKVPDGYRPFDASALSGRKK